MSSPQPVSPALGATKWTDTSWIGKASPKSIKRAREYRRRLGVTLPCDEDKPVARQKRAA